MGRQVSQLSRAMQRSMTAIAERSQVLFRIVASLAAKLLMVNFKIRHRTARLTPPSISS